MNEADRLLRERLLNMEKPSISQREFCERQIQAMVERRIGILARLGLGLLAGIGVLFVLDFLDMRSWALPSPEDMSRSVSGTFWLLGFVCALAWTALTAYPAVRGKFGSRVKPSLVAGIGAAMTFVNIIIRTFALQLAQLRADPERNRVNWDEQLAIAVFFLLVFAGLYLTLRVVYRAESSTREKLLEIEYRIADLAEKIKDRRKQ